ncbi:hypothetical protein [Streptomyces sp. LaBMicrA B280]
MKEELGLPRLVTMALTSPADIDFTMSAVTARHALRELLPGQVQAKR